MERYYHVVSLYTVKEIFAMDLDGNTHRQPLPMPALNTPVSLVTGTSTLPL